MAVTTKWAAVLAVRFPVTVLLLSSGLVIVFRRVRNALESF
jgi:hypothetical protein